MNENAGISVILPAYNAEKYLDRTLQEICEQTYKNLEIIVINDGSKDATSEIANKYAASDSRIRVIDQENTGVGEVRNRGIKLSHYDYISFVDADDEIDSDYFENLMRPFQNNDIDISVCDIDNINSNTLEHRISTIRLPYGITVTEENPSVIAKIRTFSWGKIYRKPLWTENNVWYPSGELYRTMPGFEDICCISLVAGLSKKIAHVSGSPYHYYRGHVNSLMHQSKFNYFQNSLYETMNRLQSFGVDAKYHAAVRSFLMGQLHSANRWVLKDEEIDMLWEISDKYLPEISKLKDHKILLSDQKTEDVLRLAFFDQRKFAINANEENVLKIQIPDDAGNYTNNYESYCFDMAEKVIDELPKILEEYS